MYLYIYIYIHVHDAYTGICMHVYAFIMHACAFAAVRVLQPIDVHTCAHALILCMQTI